MPASAPFRLASEFEPKGDQPEAIRRLVEGLKSGRKHQGFLAGFDWHVASPAPAADDIR